MKPSWSEEIELLSFAIDQCNGDLSIVPDLFKSLKQIYFSNKAEVDKCAVMRPSWKDAPEWANWLAQDEDGEWTWFEEKPIIKRAMDHWNSNSGRYVIAVISENNWRKTLERRPE